MTIDKTKRDIFFTLSQFLSSLNFLIIFYGTVKVALWLETNGFIYSKYTYFHDYHIYDCHTDKDNIKKHTKKKKWHSAKLFDDRSELKLGASFYLPIYTNFNISINIPPITQKILILYKIHIFTVKTVRIEIYLYSRKQFWCI